MGGGEWTAGSVYLENLCYSVASEYPGEVELYLVGPGAGSTAAGSRLLVRGVLPYGKPPRGTPAWAANGVAKRLLKTDLHASRSLARGGVRALFGPVLTYRYSKTATISYIPDLQHVLLPGMFSEEERRTRDRQFSLAAASSDRLLLTTNSALEGFREFAPAHARKMRLLHPASMVPHTVYEKDPSEVVSLYGLPERFIYIPNQFWKHKNHRVVFEALGLLKREGVELELVCTGNSSDYRHPAHFSELFEYVARSGLRGNIHYLGLVPREHLFMLMRQSLCVMNPSLFEGWGITVDEANSLGKAVLLSDIPEHREHEAPSARYFNPNDVPEVARVMREAWMELVPGPDVALEERARGEQPGRVRAYADAFMTTVAEALEEKGLPVPAGMGVIA